MVENVSIGNISTFPGIRADKNQAVKVLEEAAEIFGAWQAYDNDRENADRLRDLTNECADLITATCNLLKGLGVDDMHQAMSECEKRNEKRGRM